MIVRGSGLLGVRENFTVTGGSGSSLRVFPVGHDVQLGSSMLFASKQLGFSCSEPTVGAL